MNYLQPAKYLLVMALVTPKSLSFFLLAQGRRRNRSQPKDVENDYVAVANTQCLSHLEVTFLFCLALELCAHYQRGVLG